MSPVANGEFERPLTLDKRRSFSRALSIQTWPHFESLAAVGMAWTWRGPYFSLNRWRLESLASPPFKTIENTMCPAFSLREFHFSPCAEQILCTLPRRNTRILHLYNYSTVLIVSFPLFCKIPNWSKIPHGWPRADTSCFHRYTNDLLVIMYIYHSPATGTARTRGKSIPRDQLRTSGRLTAGSSNLLGLATVAAFDFSLSICLMHSSRFFSRR